MSQSQLDCLFYPKSVAIVGATENPESYGCYYMQHMLNYGFAGAIYPINNRQPEIMGVKTYPCLDDIPGTVDYVMNLVGVEHAPDILTRAHHKGVKVMHILAGRASETGRPEGKQLEEEIGKLSRQYGIRVLGPNCLGVFCPESGLSFGFEFPREPGNIGALFQSGGEAVDLVHIAALRGLRFSKVISYGNALDINEIDLIRYLAEDPKTEIILSYLEGLRSNGREYLELIRETARRKPVVICKGGRTSVGSRMTMSHTASLAGSTNLWGVAIRQAGAVPVKNINQMVNMAAAFHYLPPIKGKKLGIVGAGGGRSILSADEWEENGFEVPPLPQEIRNTLRRKGSQLWDWINNPADTSIVIPGDSVTIPDVLEEIAKHPVFDLIAADASEDPPFDKEPFIHRLVDNMEGYIQVSRNCHKPFIIIFDERSPGIRDMDSYMHRTRAQMRTRLVEEELPFFPSVEEAARAVNELITYYRRRNAGD